MVLSAQATDVGVNKATRALFREVTTPQQMVDLGEEGLKQHIKTIGLFNAKAKNVIALSEILVREHGGVVPADRDVLTTLPGVGRKTANVVMNCAFGAETFAVDTHIFRLGNRTGLAKGKTVIAVEKALEKKVPQPFRVGAHHWLILHGRYICKARTPECWRCPVADLCGFKAKIRNRRRCKSGSRGDAEKKGEPQRRRLARRSAATIPGVNAMQMEERLRRRQTPLRLPRSSLRRCAKPSIPPDRGATPSCLPRAYRQALPALPHRDRAAPAACLPTW